MRLLDLFCGAGGAAMGYHRAGFEVVGVDIEPQPHFPFEFVQADAIEYLSETGAAGFDVIHASPPCQAYSRMRNLPWLKGREYWDSIPPTRAALACQDVPWVIENVADAPLDGIMLCGQMFGLDEDDGSPIYRHRLFESTAFLMAPGHPKHTRTLVPGPMLGASTVGQVCRHRLDEPQRTRAGHPTRLHRMDRTPTHRGTTGRSVTGAPRSGQRIEQSQTGSSVMGAALTEALTVAPLAGTPWPARTPSDPDRARARVQVADPVPSATT